MKGLLALVIIMMMLSSSVASAETNSVPMEPDSYAALFSPFFDIAVNNDGSVKRSLPSVSSPIFTGLASGLSLATLVKLYDLYGATRFLEIASLVSDYLTTTLNDPRYPLIATYYDKQHKITSNYRSVVDNFLIAWGLSELSNRIDPQKELARKIQEDRSDFVSNKLNLFDRDVGFVEQLRVDRNTTSNVFTVFNNLMAAFIITESRSTIFDIFKDKPAEVLKYVQDHAVTDDGGVHTLIANGFSDDLITLRNTALYANLALDLYTQTNDVSYLSVANRSMQFIQQEFYDIGVTGGYFETLKGGSPVQQSKSLFSHALILQLLLRLANLGDNDARLNFLAVWRTISRYFRTGSYFYSSLDRGGNPASATIDTVDNLMMIYSMSSLPLFSISNITQEVEFRDRIVMTLTLQVPQKVQSTLTITVNDEEVKKQIITGKDGLQQLTIELDPNRPNGDLESFDYVLTLSSEGVVTDQLTAQITVSLAPGLDLSIGVISVFSIIAVVIFVLFMKRYGDITTAPQV